MNANAIRDFKDLKHKTFRVKGDTWEEEADRIEDLRLKGLAEKVEPQGDEKEVKHSESEKAMTSLVSKELVKRAKKGKGK